MKVQKYGQLLFKMREQYEKGELEPKELASYQLGKDAAYREVLEFLTPNYKEIYENFKFEDGRIKKILFLQLRDLVSRLNRARSTYLIQKKLIEKLRQMECE